MTMKGGTILTLFRSFKLHSKPLPSAAVSRFKSTCASTMDLVSGDPSEYTLVKSTLQHVVERDFNTVMSSEPSRGELHFLKVSLSSSSARFMQSYVESYEMDLIDAAAKRESFDKILLLVHHGEREVVDGNSCLTGRGVGQALNLSRRIATFCNEETALMPDLIVAAPTQHAVQTAMLAFPHYSPESVKSVTWICHPHVDSGMNNKAVISSLRKACTGIDYSLYDDKNEADDSIESEEDMLQQAYSFLEWVRGRDEKIIVGKPYTFLSECVDFGHSTQTDSTSPSFHFSSLERSHFSSGFWMYFELRWRV